MHKFDYSFLGNGQLPVSLVDVVGDIDSLRVLLRDRRQKFAEVFAELKAVAQVQSVKCSNELEGIVTTDERLREIVIGNADPYNYNEKEIAGYSNALAEIHANYDYIFFSEENIKRLHSIMFNLAGYNYAGQYKQKDNEVIDEERKTGMLQIHFYPTSAFDTPSEMKQLMFAYMEARNNPNINLLLLIPCVILDFLCIQPFQEGNGRLSRLLTLLLLHRSNFDVGKYISFEAQINKRRKSYYDAMLCSFYRWHETKNDYAPFVMEFLVTLHSCYRELDRKFAVIDSK